MSCPLLQEFAGNYTGGDDAEGNEIRFEGLLLFEIWNF